MTDTFHTTPKVRTAMVTGQHPYDVPSFIDCFNSLGGIAAYPQHMEDFCAAPPELRDQYEAIVFYHFHQATPTGEGAWYEAAMKAALERIGETDQGVLILHHAILAFPEWDFWTELVGIEDRSFSFHIAETIDIEIANPEHPITQGLEPWTQVEETYLMADPDAASEVLLTTDHEKSMNALGWTRQHRNARVFCLELGHDASAFSDPNFRKVLARGIEWIAGRI